MWSEVSLTWGCLRASRHENKRWTALVPVLGWLLLPAPCNGYFVGPNWFAATPSSSTSTLACAAVLRLAYLVHCQIPTVEVASYPHTESYLGLSHPSSTALCGEKTNTTTITTTTTTSSSSATPLARQNLTFLFVYPSTPRAFLPGEASDSCERAGFSSEVLAKPLGCRRRV